MIPCKTHCRIIVILTIYLIKYIYISPPLSPPPCVLQEQLSFQSQTCCVSMFNPHPAPPHPAPPYPAPPHPTPCVLQEQLPDLFNHFQSQSFCVSMFNPHPAPPHPAPPYPAPPHPAPCVLQEQLPDLFNHFQSQSFCVSMFASSWFLTLFTTTLSIATASRIFDIFVSEVGFHRTRSQRSAYTPISRWSMGPPTICFWWSYLKVGGPHTDTLVVK